MFKAILLAVALALFGGDAHGQIEEKLFFASVRNRFNDFLGCTSIISPRLVITAATVVEGRRPEELLVVLGNHNVGHFGYQHLPEVYFERVMESYLDEIKTKSNCSLNSTMSSNEANTELAEADFKVTSMRKILRTSSVDKIPTTHIRAVDKIVIHPIYTGVRKYSSNVAILRLEHSIKIGDLKPLRIELSDMEEVKDKLLLLGWTKYQAFEKNITVKEIGTCSSITKTNYSGSEFLCIKNEGVASQSVLGYPCLAGCPLVHNNTLYGMITVGHKKLTKSNLNLGMTAAKLLPFLQAVANGIDFDNWQRDIQQLVEQFVKNVVGKAFF